MHPTAQNAIGKYVIYGLLLRAGSEGSLSRICYDPFGLGRQCDRQAVCCGRRFNAGKVDLQLLAMVMLLLAALNSWCWF